MVIFTGAVDSALAISMPPKPAPMMTTWGRVFAFIIGLIILMFFDCENLHNYYNQNGLICKVLLINIVQRNLGIAKLIGSNSLPTQQRMKKGDRINCRLGKCLLIRSSDQLR